MTAIYTNNYVFPQEYFGSVWFTLSAKQQIRELRKHS